VSDTVSFQYDGERRPWRVIEAATGQVTSTFYDGDGRPFMNIRQLGVLLDTQHLITCTRYSETGKPVRTWGPVLVNPANTCPA
jgi:hypothetical protein